MVPKMQTTSAKNAENGRLWAKWSAFWAKWRRSCSAGWVSARILGSMPTLLAGDPVVVAVQIRAVTGVSAVEGGCACFTGLLAA